MMKFSAASIARAPGFLCALALCILSAFSASAAGPPRATSGSQWLSYNDGLDGQRFSPLKQITPTNAAQIAEVCRVQIDGPTSFTAGLIVVGGVIYTNTPTETRIVQKQNRRRSGGCAVVIVKHSAETLTPMHRLRCHYT